MNSFEYIKILNVNSNIGEILFNCSDNIKRKFNLNNILNSKNISNGMKNTWKYMFKSGDFNKVYILSGDLVWPGWCKIFSSELNNYLEEVL